MQLPMSGNPQNGALNGYIILGKADVTGSAIPASYAIGKILMRRGTNGSGHNIDVYNVTSSRGWDNEVFHVNLEFDGESGAALSRFGRLVKCTYNSIVYHAIETVNNGGDPTTERIFEGYAKDAALVFVDATYVSSVTEYGNIGMSIEAGGQFGIGHASPTSLLHISENKSEDIQLKVENESTSSRAGISIINNSSTLNIQQNSGSAIFENLGTSGTDFYQKGATGDFKFYTTDSNTERLIIKNNGNVGIGTITPSQQLHLYHATHSQMRLESPGDVTLTLWADNDNATETDNPMILLSQDNLSLIHI